MNNELQQFVREALARGLSRDEIRSMLAAARWRAEEIDAELERWGDGPAGLPRYHPACRPGGRPLVERL